ncbi:hypothetical protein [Microcystis sp. M59BS1]|uniref:hypothetical protein n=1 Tax=Microcystis sp. M59BS1 TaxID=2771201 RepID=UPI002582E1D8|nr:hypothetical protein [Microcystis sp. M59BS1]MCA2517842.1 hypothetical protein [Microcystis sp. M59BS1]MCA2552060.1 hypothetical protein [Microcystis sp. M53BS1]
MSVISYQLSVISYQLSVIGSQESGVSYQESGVRRREIIFIYSPHTPHPTPHTRPLGKAFCRKPSVLSVHDQMAVTVLSFH